MPLRPGHAPWGWGCAAGACLASQAWQAKRMPRTASWSIGARRMWHAPPGPCRLNKEKGFSVAIMVGSSASTMCLAAYVPACWVGRRPSRGSHQRGAGCAAPGWHLACSTATGLRACAGCAARFCAFPACRSVSGHLVGMPLLPDPSPSPPLWSASRPLPTRLVVAGSDASRRRCLVQMDTEGSEVHINDLPGPIKAEKGQQFTFTVREPSQRSGDCFSVRWALAAARAQRAGRGPQPGGASARCGSRLLGDGPLGLAAPGPGPSMHLSDNRARHRGDCWPESTTPDCLCPSAQPRSATSPTTLSTLNVLNVLHLTTHPTTRQLRGVCGGHPARRHVGGGRRHGVAGGSVQGGARRGGTRGGPGCAPRQPERAALLRPCASRLAACASSMCARLQVPGATTRALWGPTPKSRRRAPLAPARVGPCRCLAWIRPVQTLPIGGVSHSLQASF